MYKKPIITTFFLVSTIGACEYIDGVIIEPKVICLFNTASAACRSNLESLNKVEELYIQYLCLIAQYGEREAYAKGASRILEQIKDIIQHAS